VVYSVVRLDTLLYGEVGRIRIALVLECDCKDGKEFWTRKSRTEIARVNRELKLGEQWCSGQTAGLPVRRWGIKILTMGRNLL